MPTDAVAQDMRLWRTPKGVRRAYMDGRFGQIHYRIAESGARHPKAPLVCLHLTRGSGRVYGRWLAEMAKDRTAVAPDFPGFGDSDPPPAAPEIADYAAAMGDVVDRLGFGPVDVMGYQAGSRAAVELAQQRPDQVRRLILVSAPIYTDAELDAQYVTMGTADADETPEDGSHLLRRWNEHRRWTDKAAPLIFVERSIAEALRSGATGWWAHDAAFRYLLGEHLPKVKQPVLILNLNNDLREPTARAAKYLKNGNLHNLPNYSHGMLDMHTAEVAAIVREFLDGEAEDIGRTQKTPTPRRPRSRRHPIRRAFMDGPYGQLHYRIAEPQRRARSGAAARRAPLICFHMSPNSSRIYDAILQEMGKDRVAMAPDTPGFGESDAPEEPPEIEDYARTMAHLIDTLGFSSVDVMGYHTGSETAVELALQRPSLVRRIVQISCPVFSDEELERHRETYAPLRIEADGSHLVRKWRRMLPFYGPRVPRAIVARNFVEGLRGGPVAHWGHRAAFNYDLRDKLPRVSQPILVVNPNDDLVKQTPRGLPLMQRGHLYEIKDRGHGFLDTMTAEFSRVLREFLDGEAP